MMLYPSLEKRILMMVLFFIASTLILMAAPDPVEIIKKSYHAHGGVNGTDSLKIAFKFTNRTRINEGQSFVTEAPFDTYVTEDELWIDRPAQRTVYKTMGTLAGGFTERHVVSLEHGHGYDVNPEQKSYYEISSMPNPRQLLQNFLLKNAAANPDKIKYVDERKIRDAVTYHLIYDTIHLFVNKNSLLVERIERANFESHSGMGNLMIDLVGYKKVGKIMMPQQYITTKTNLVYGTIVNTYAITDARSEFQIAASLFQLPTGFTTSAPNPNDCEASKLGENLYLIENVDGPGGAYQIIAAEFSDYVLITEAPLDISTTRRVLTKVSSMFPNKKVKYIVQSHAHYDHIGGILGYSENGATILASKDAGAIINKMHAAYEKGTKRSWGKPVIETVAERTVIKDAVNECIVFNIGPNPHSRQILVTYFPLQKILFQADLLDEGMTDLPADADFIKKIRALKLNIDAIVPAHGPVLRGEALAKAMR